MTKLLFLNLKKIYKDHIENKEEVQKIKDASKAKCQKEENADIYCLAVFDYQILLQAPVAETSILYYKQKLSVSNFTMYNIGKSKAFS